MTVHSPSRTGAKNRRERAHCQAAILTASSLKMTVYKMAARDCECILSTILRNNKGLWTTKVYTERLQPRSLIYTFFGEKRYSCTPFRIPRLELCIPFNCFKFTVFQIWIKHKTRAFSQLFHCHKMHLLALMGHFADRIDRFPHPFIYFNKKNPYPFIHPKPEIGTPIRAEPARIGRYREYPAGCEQLPQENALVFSPPSPFFFYATQTITWLEPVCTADNELCIWKVLNIRGQIRWEKPSIRSRTFDLLFTYSGTSNLFIQGGKGVFCDAWWDPNHQRDAWSGPN